MLDDAILITYVLVHKQVIHFLSVYKHHSLFISNGLWKKEKNHKMNKFTLVQSTEAYTAIKYLLQQ